MARHGSAWRGKARQGFYKTMKRPHVKTENDTLIPRREFAETILGVSQKTVSRMNLPTTYIGGIAYIAKEAALRIISEGVHRNPKKD